jgi:hypothetical protein
LNTNLENELKSILGKKFSILESYYIKNYSPHDIRMKMCNGNFVLQNEVFVALHYSKLIWQNGDFTDEENIYVWIDADIV